MAVPIVLYFNSSGFYYFLEVLAVLEVAAASDGSVRRFVAGRLESPAILSVPVRSLF